MQKIKDLYDEEIIKLGNNVILGIEGLGPIRNLSDIELLKEAHIKSVSLTWNDINLLASGTKTGSKEGVTQFGYQVLELLGKYKFLLDLSHANERTFDDCLNYYCGKCYVSHSNVYDICKNERNLKKEQIIKLRQRGGVICLNAYAPFVGKNNDISSLLDHILYLVELIGENNIGLGLDDDTYLNSSLKSGMIEEFKEAVNVNLLKQEMKKKIKSDLVEKVMYKNLIHWLND